MNIGANRNAHGKRTVSTKQPEVKDFTSWPIIRIKSFSFFFFFFFLWGGAQLQCIYCLVLYTDLKAAEGN